ncbi:MAG: 50S ribosomal protein L11 methyltransferase [Thermoanaerobaculia bacterium]
MTGAVRLTVPAGRTSDEIEEKLFDVFAEIASSWSRDASGDLRIWVAENDIDSARAALHEAGVNDLESEREPARDWVAESAALQRAVVVGPYLLDPHDGERATPAGSHRRLHIPAARAFGTGSHESTRLALRLLLQETLAGQRVLDVGCGTGTLAFVALLQGAKRAIAFDLDPDAAFATREQARGNEIQHLACFAGPLDALSLAPPFDLVIANMIVEEVRPLLSGIRKRLRPGGRLITSGQLQSREHEWLAILRAEGFRPLRMAAENEWFAATSVRR